DRDTGRNKGFGFVEMSTDQEAADAITKYNGADFEGRSITVNEARPMPPREGGGGGGRGFGGGGRDRGGRGGGRQRWESGLANPKWGPIFSFQRARSFLSSAIKKKTFFVTTCKDSQRAP